MSRRPGWRAAAAVVALLVVVASAVRAQVVVPLTEEPGRLDAMRQRVARFVAALVDYTRDVRLSAEGLESVLTHYAALERMHGEDEAAAIVEQAFQGEGYDFAVVVNDATYVAWCRERGLEPGAFFRQFLRLQALWMRAESLDGLSRALDELPEQRAEIDAAREEMGEEAYARSAAALDAAEAMVSETRAMMERLPVAAAEEAALLEAHGRRIDDTLGRE